MPPLKTAILLFATLISLSAEFAYADQCINKIDSERFSYDSAVTYLEESGFILRRGDKRNYNPIKLSATDASTMRQLHHALSTKEDPSLRFWLILAGANLRNPGQASCFIEAILLTDEDRLVTYMQYVSRLIAKRHKNDFAISAMTNIASHMNSKTIIAYLKAEKAVYFTSGGMGIGVNYANARHNKKRVQHLPNSIMRVMANILEAEDVTHHSTVYQVKHMGYALD